jgi:hypothetical protein
MGTLLLIALLAPAAGDESALTETTYERTTCTALPPASVPGT